MIQRALLLAVMTAFAAPAIASAQAPWRQVYRDSDVRVLFDTASARLASPGTWTTVTSWDYTRPRVLENKKSYTRLVQRVHLRCSPVRVKRVRSTVYGPNNVMVRDEGEVDARDQAAMAWDRPRGSTAAANAFNSICGVVTRKARPRAAVAPKPAATRTTTSASNR